MERRLFLRLLGLGTGTMAIATLPEIIPKILKDETQTKNRPIMEHGFYGFFQGKVTSLMFERSDGVVSFWGNGVCVRLAGELDTERETVFSIEYNFDLYHTRRQKVPILHLVISEIGEIDVPENFIISIDEMRKLLEIHQANNLITQMI